MKKEVFLIHLEEALRNLDIALVTTPWICFATKQRIKKAMEQLNVIKSALIRMPKPVPDRPVKPEKYNII